MPHIGFAFLENDRIELNWSHEALPWMVGNRQLSAENLDDLVIVIH